MSTLESLHRSSGDHRIVWEVTYAYDMQHHVSRGYDDDVFSHNTREQMVAHFIAPTYALCRAMFDHINPAHCNREFVSAVPLCTINNEMDLTRGWRG